MAFKENLIALQEKNYETNYRLAKSIGVHQTTIAKWRDGIARPRLRHLGKLCEHYGCSIGELLDSGDAKEDQ